MYFILNGVPSSTPLISFGILPKIFSSTSKQREARSVNNLANCACADLICVSKPACSAWTPRPVTTDASICPERDRSLMPSIILRTWRDVNQNIGTYRQAFGDKFVLINNNPKEVNTGFSPELIRPYFEASKAKGKPKTPEEQAKSKAERENEIHRSIDEVERELRSHINSLEEHVNRRIIFSG